MVGSTSRSLRPQLSIPHPIQSSLVLESALPSSPIHTAIHQKKPLIFENAMAPSCQHCKSQSFVPPRECGSSLRPIGPWHFLAVSPSIFPILPRRIKASPVVCPPPPPPPPTPSEQAVSLVTPSPLFLSPRLCKSNSSLVFGALTSPSGRFLDQVCQVSQLKSITFDEMPSNI